jgi:hypothetical protein
MMRLKRSRRRRKAEMQVKRRKLFKGKNRMVLFLVSQLKLRRRQRGYSSGSFVLKRQMGLSLQGRFLLLIQRRYYI